MTSPAVVIGIDAGATKTAGVAATLDGIVLTRARGGPSAVVGMPDERCRDVLAAIVRDLCPRTADIAHVVIGLSGVDFADEREDQHRILAEAIGVSGARLTLLNDSIVALAGAASADRATIVQHGTEVTLAYRSGAGHEVVFDSLGVADCYDLRHRTVPLVARMIDGRAVSTGLRDAVLAHCGVSAERFTEWMLRDPDARATIMRIAPVVFGCWRDGDPAATAVIDRAIDDYVLATIAMARRIGEGPFEACFAGGTIAQGGGQLIDAIGAVLARQCSDAQVGVPNGTPEEGALAIALHAELVTV